MLEVGFKRSLLVRSSIETKEVAYYIVFAPSKTSLQEMALAAGSRWVIEECFELSKSELGLDHYEVRLWQAWYRHCSLVLWAMAFLAVTQHFALSSELKKSKSLPITNKTSNLKAFKLKRGLYCP